MEATRLLNVSLEGSRLSVCSNSAVGIREKAGMLPAAGGSLAGGILRFRFLPGYAQPGNRNPALPRVTTLQGRELLSEALPAGVFVRTVEVR